MKTLVDIDDAALDAARRELGTVTKKDTVNAALAYVAARGERARRAAGSPLLLGVGEDLADPEVRRRARS